MSRLASKGVYDEASEDDGARDPVDHIWPRGISKGKKPKGKKRVDEWFKLVAPTAVLRGWFHEGGDFSDPSREYRKELEERAESRKAFDGLLELARRPGTPPWQSDARPRRQGPGAQQRRGPEGRVGRENPAPASPGHPSRKRACARSILSLK